MHSWRNVGRQCWAACLAVVVFSSVGIAAEPSWVSLTPAGGLAVEPVAREAAPLLTVTASDLKTLSLEVQWDGLTVTPTKSGQNGEFVEITWPDAAFAGEVGEPNLPVLRRLFVAPEGASITATVQAGVPAVLDLAAAGFPPRIKPEQPPVEKVPGALQAAPFVLNEAAYAQNTDLLPVRAEVTELGIVRGYRLCLLEVRPVTYNPARGLLTWWPELSVKLDFAGGSRSAVERSPLGLHRVVLNPELLSATRAGGNYLIVTGTEFQAGIAGFAAAKAAQGFTVSTHAVVAGTANTTIKAYIQGLYADPLTAPDYVLLVGDTDTIPHWVGQGEGSPATDIQYGCMDGGTDYYPDIAVGRFPVDDPDDLQIMVNKTLYYENGPLADPDYLKRAVFMASTDNYEITEGTHNYVINTHLAPNEYICDKLYTVTYDATTQDVRNSFNAGRFYGVYSGHGGTYSWGDGPPFSESDVQGLTNANMYAMICSFSCITGTYTADKCFMETWVLEENKGAVTAWGSSVNSYWTEDDILEKRLFDAIFDAEDDVASEIGPIYNETKMRFLAHFGDDSTTRRYFEMYNLMGDPALPLPGTCSDTGTVQLNRGRYACADSMTVRVSDCGLNLDDNVVDTVTVAVNSDSENGVESLLLSETNANSATFEGMIELSTTDAAGVLLVADGDVVWATYIDADDGQGGINVPVNASATVDCTAPVISGVQVTGVEPRSATVSISADEPIRGSVQYGLSCAGLTGSADGSGFANPATVSVTGLQDNTTYFFAVEATDEAGNSTSDDNGGACYSFTTPEIPDFFTELFDSNNDLDNLTLTFTP
ncbi:MAG: hypothetical protein JXB13_00215, partial [Phycisphaerae bacterium]|nr:hypothetical protein [Phycisphaerae bacterium]